MTVRAELSEKNKYYIDKHRYYELKHFCLQYPIWKKLYLEIDGLVSCTYDPVRFSKSNMPSDPTSKLAEERLLYLDRMKIVEQTAIAADSDLASYILKAVTEGLSYTYLKTKLEMPCGRDMYYDRYRRFFWLLDKIRDWYFGGIYYGKQNI